MAGRSQVDCDSCSSLSQPKVVTDTEDEELRTQMEELRLANEEVAGDDDTSDQEGVAVEDSEEAGP